MMGSIWEAFGIYFGGLEAVRAPIASHWYQLGISEVAMALAHRVLDGVPTGAGALFG